MNNFQLMDELWRNIERLGALCATPGVDEETKKSANEQIKELLSKLKQPLSQLTAQAAGVIV